MNRKQNKAYVISMFIIFLLGNISILNGQNLNEEVWKEAKKRASIYADCAENVSMILNGWLKYKCDSKSYLFSECYSTKWNYHNAAADNYSSLVFHAYFINPELNKPGGGLYKTLDSSIRLCGNEDGKLPYVYDVKTKNKTKRASTEEIAEWLRDGLIRVCEIMGTDNIWYREMIKLADTIIKMGETRGGIINLIENSKEPTEAAGNLMQTFARLTILSGDVKYLKQAEKIADHYLLGDVIKNIGKVDFADHTCELVPGLSEVFIVEKKLKRSKFAQYHRPIRILLDRILEVGVNPQTGLWYRTADLSKNDSGKGICPDTWGYVLFAFQNYDQATGENRYKQRIFSFMDWFINNKGNFDNLRNIWPTFNRGSFSADDWSDSYESMIILSNLYDYKSEEVFDWLDWATIKSGKHRKNRTLNFGSGNGGHFDGSTGRTLCLHMMRCSQGVRTIPYIKGLGCGAVKKGQTLYIYLESQDSLWNGTLLFDPQRKIYHENKLDWARINSAPSWFTVHPESSYKVSINNKPPVTIKGKKLIKGLPVNIKSGKHIKLVVYEVENTNLVDISQLGTEPLAQKQQPPDGINGLDPRKHACRINVEHAVKAIGEKARDSFLKTNSHSIWKASVRNIGAVFKKRFYREITILNEA
ncbi:MAG: hypothetical protein KAS17_04565 [Victivallaceae bacterium]|nr:hypothetical protein [Victivallaceae bacterium]